MDERIMQFRVGVMVLATLLIAAILLVLFGEVPRFGWRRGTYTLQVVFPSAPGVTKDTPVRKSGILIGRVSDVRFTEDGQVLVDMDLHQDVQLRRTERPRIKGGLFGDAVIEFVPGDEPRELGHYQPGDVIRDGVVVSDPLEVLADLRGELSDAITTFDRAGSEVATLVSNLNRLVEDNDQQIQRIIQKTDQALTGFNRAMDNIDRIAGDEEIQEALRKSIADLPRMLEASQATFDRLQRTIDLTDQNLENLSRFTGPLGERGDQLVLRVADSVDKLDALMAQMVDFGRAINSHEGSLGQLIHNPDLYHSLLRASRNIERASQQLEPILHDARVFSDKVSRNPGVIVRDAVRPGPGIK